MIDVTMKDGSTFVVRRLLTKARENVKLAKSDNAERGFMTVGLSLAPARQSGFEVCPKRSPGCTRGCIFTSGNAHVFPLINTARIAKTRAYFLHRPEFMSLLRKELRLAVKRAKKAGLRLAVRLNVFSDISWETVHKELFTEFPTVQFYDYTKVSLRALRHAMGKLPPNYHLTFSRSEKNEGDCITVLEAGGNVAVVFDSKALPDLWHGYQVVNGDKTDLRFLDQRGGVVVGLYAKGRGRKDTSGFVVPTRIALSLI